MTSRGEHINTFTGVEFYITDPCPDDINPRDIAHALSLVCRANGHFKHFYSVGQHSVNCCKEAAARGYSYRVQLACLLHDGSEAYISDMTRPAKKHLSQYVELEEKIQQVLYGRFGLHDLSENELNLVALIDDSVLWHEFVVLHDYRLWEPEPKLFSAPNLEFSNMQCVEDEFLAILSILTAAVPSALIA